MILSQLSLLGSWRKLFLLNDGHFGFPNVWEHHDPIVILYLVDLTLYLVYSIARNLIVFFEKLGNI
jgi:hypothetical protein